MSEMVRTEVTVELVTLAEQINAEHRAFVGSLKKTAEHGIRAGELLTEAKSKCNHGEWLGWLGQNFDGAPRTAQEYMRLYNHRDEIMAKTRSPAHLSISGALKEIAAPSALIVAPEPEGPTADEEEQDREYIEACKKLTRGWMAVHGFVNTEEKQQALERALAAEAPLPPHTWRLFKDLGLEDLFSLGAQVGVDGWIFEGDPDDESQKISYRVPFGAPPEERKIVRRSLPITNPDEGVEACLKRGAWVMGILDYRGWRLFMDWWARTLAADPQIDVDVWGPAGAQSADWRQTDAAADFLSHRAFHPEATVKEFVKEENLEFKEFKRSLEVVEFIVMDYAERVYRYLTGLPEGTKSAKWERWREFETS